MPGAAGSWVSRNARCSSIRMAASPRLVMRSATAPDPITLSIEAKLRRAGKGERLVIANGAEAEVNAGLPAVRRHQGGVWLTTQSAANWSPPVTPCFPLLCLEKQAIFPFCGTTSGQHFFKFCRLFRWLWCFPFAARTTIIPPQNRDIF